MACRLIDLALVAFKLLMFKVGGIIGISKIEFFKGLKGSKNFDFFCSLVSLVEVMFYHKVNPVDNYMFKINNRNTRAKCEICPKYTIKTPERHQWFRCLYFYL